MSERIAKATTSRDPCLDNDRLSQILAVLEEVKRGNYAARLIPETDDLISEVQRGVNELIAQTARDITEYKRAEEALRESEERFRSVVQTATDAIISIGSRGDIIFWNQGAETIFGYSADEIVGKPLTTVMPERFHSRHKAGVQRVVATRESSVVGKTVELTGLRKDGSEFSMELSLAVWETGEDIFFTGIVRDITARKRAEQALDEQRAFLRRVIDLNPNPIFVRDREGRFTLANQALADFYGTTVDDLVGKTEADFNPNPEEVERYLRDDREIMDSRQTRSLEDSGTDAAGNLHWFQVFLLPLVDEDGTANQVLGIATDITERRQAEEEIRRLGLAVEQAGDGITVTDLQGQLVFVNEAWARMHQYPDTAELVGQPLSVFHTPEQLEREVIPFNERVMQTGIHSGEVGHVRKDGTTFPTAMTVTLMHDEAGQPIGLIGAARDITAEKRLSEVSQRLAAAATLADVANAMLGPVSITAGAERSFVILFKNWVGDMPMVAHTLALWDPALTPAVLTDRHVLREQYPMGEAIHVPREMAVIEDMDDPRLGAVLPALDYEVRTRTQSVALLPLISQERVIGFVVLERWQATPFTAADLQAAQTLVNQGALAIAAMQQVEERENELQAYAARRAQEVATGTEIAQAIAAVPALDVLYETVVTLIKERFGYYHAQIFRYEPGVNAVVLVVGYGETGRRMKEAGHKLEMGRGVVGTAAATGEPQLAADVAQDPAWQPNPHLPDTKGELAVPIKLRDEVLGVLDVQSDVAGALTGNDQILLQGLCGQIAAAIESTRLRQGMERRLREVSTLYRDYSRAAWGDYLEAREYERASAYVYDGTNVMPVGAQDLAPLPEGAAVPLTVHGEVIGTIGLAEDPTRVWTEEEFALLEAVAEQVAQTMERGRLFEQTQSALEETQQLYAASHALTTAPDERVVIQRLKEHLIVSGLDRVVIAMIVGTVDGQPLVEVQGVWDRAGQEDKFLGNRFTPKQIPMIERAIEGELLLINDFETDTEVDDVSRATFKHLGVKSAAVLPMMVGREALGWILLETVAAPRVFRREQMEPYLALANQAAAAIQNRRLFQAAERRAKRERMIREITAKMRASTDLDTILNTAVEELGKALNVSRTFVRLTTGTSGGGDGDGDGVGANRE